MAERDVTYTTTRELPCGCDCGACPACNCGDSSSTVIICLVEEVAPPFINEDDEEIAFDYIEAEIISCCRQERRCPPLYSYVLRYDDEALLVDEILPQHITGVVCQSCEFGYFASLIETGTGTFTLSVLDTTSINLTLAANVLSGVVILYDAVAASNMLTIDADGLLVRPLAVLDTTSINLTVTGTPPAQQVVSGVVILYDAVANANMLTIDADGLLVRPLAVLDTTSINLTVTGTPPAQQVVSGVVILYDAVANANMLTIDADGLLVRPIAVLDSTTINFTLTGTPPAQQVVGGSVILSPNGGNALIDAGNGLFVPSTEALTLADTDCIALSFELDGDLIATPIIAETEGNLLSCTVDGLFVALGLESSCSVALSYDVYGELNADVIVSTAADNQLQLICDGSPDEGLYVAFPSVDWADILGYPEDSTALTEYILELVPCWQNSIVLDEGSGCLELENDVLAPGPNMYYGTDGAGVKGWYATAI